MSNERTDEFLSWRARLDDPDESAGQELEDREAAWERLMDRVRRAPRKRRYSGLWIAAACLILVLIPVVHLFQNRQTPVVTLRPVVPKPVTGAGSEVLRSAQVVSRESLQPAISGSTATALVRAAQHHSLERPESTPVRGTPAVLAEISGTPGILTVTPPDTNMKMPHITTLKIKQLKVVHINELEGSGIPAPAITATDASRHFGIFLQPPLSRAALPPPPPAADPAILKVKLSSPN